MQGLIKENTKVLSVEDSDHDSWTEIISQIYDTFFAHFQSQELSGNTNNEDIGSVFNKLFAHFKIVGFEATKKMVNEISVH